MQQQTDLLNTIQIIVQRTTYYYILPILRTNYKNLCWISHSILAFFGDFLVYRNFGGKLITKRM
jgi:hypothetical protein